MAQWQKCAFTLGTRFMSSSGKHKEIPCKRKLNMLRLARTEGVSPRLFFKLLELFPDPEDALERAGEFSLKGGRKSPIVPFTLAQAEEEIAAVEGFGAEIITFEDCRYPKLLLQLDDCPPILTCKGNLDLLSANLFAIVGARSSSLNAQALAKAIASNLSKKADITIVSGLAKGIDTAAHKGAFPKTIAVIAGGIDNVYPLQNEDLYKSISREGLVVAEMPIFSKPLAQSFPQRNRLISGLSLGVLVVEASYNSGSLVTARFALEQGREVFAVPGFPLDPRSRGTNKLIKDGANIVEDADDIASVLPALKKIEDKLQERKSAQYQSPLQEISSQTEEEARQSILSLLSHSPISLDLLIESVDLPIQLTYRLLLELELAGRVMRCPGNLIAKILEP